MHFFYFVNCAVLHLCVTMWSKRLEHNISPHASGRKIVKICGLFFARIKSFTKLYDAGKKWEVASKNFSLIVRPTSYKDALGIISSFSKTPSLT